jgi:hypothetical protein
VQRPITCFLLVFVTTGAMAGGLRKTALVDQQSAQDRSFTSIKADPQKEIRLLYPRIGTWDVTIRTEAGNGSPQRGFDKGVATIKKGPGGFSIVQEFWSRGTSGHVKGQSYTWWDKATRIYKSVWCDNAQGCTEFTTNISGMSWIVKLDSEANGRKIHTIIRATMTQDLNAIHEEVTTAYDDGPTALESVSEYVRVLSKAGREVLKE